MARTSASLTDKMFHNKENAANLAGILQSIVVTHDLDAEEKDLADKLCEDACQGLEEG